MRKTVQPTVTIGIPTHNRADSYLPVALASALSQDYANLEILVSDNASTDRTGELVRSADDARIRYFRHDVSIGGAGNFNFCVEQARGDYFLLLHDDDLIDRDFVSACVGAIPEGRVVGVVRTGIRLVDEEGQVVSEMENRASGLSFEEFLRSWFDGRTAHYLPNTLYNTSGLQRLGGFHSRRYLFQDAVALVRLASELGRVDIREVKASFRRHGENYGGHPDTAQAWVDDCLHLRDVIMELVADTERDVVYRDANRFLARKSYRAASGIPGFLDRVELYRQIYASFGYRHPPPALSPARWLRTVRKRARRLTLRGST